MKKLMIALLACFLFAAMPTYAQHTALKIGYTNADEILQALPEANTIRDELKKYNTQLETQLKSMTDEYEKKLEDYKAKIDALAPAVKQAKEKELITLQQQISEFQQKANEDLQKKQVELLEPVYNKINKAIEDIAKAEHYTHIFNTSINGLPILVYATEESDITNKVITKLGGTVPKKTETKPNTPTTGGK